MTKSNLLLVDDDRHVLDSMAEWLRGQGYQLETASGYIDALERLRKGSFDLVLADVRLRDGDGFASVASRPDDGLRLAGRRD